MAEESKEVRQLRRAMTNGIRRRRETRHVVLAFGVIVAVLAVTLILIAMALRNDAPSNCSSPCGPITTRVPSSSAPTTQPQVVIVVPSSSSQSSTTTALRSSSSPATSTTARPPAPSSSAPTSTTLPSASPPSTSPPSSTTSTTLCVPPDARIHICTN